MTDWQQRVVAERDELKTRFDKLCEFLSKLAIEFKVEKQDDVSLLCDQRDAMRAYLTALNKRIARFENQS